MTASLAWCTELRGYDDLAGAAARASRIAADAGADERQQQGFAAAIVTAVCHVSERRHGTRLGIDTRNEGTFVLVRARVSGGGVRIRADDPHAEHLDRRARPTDDLASLLSQSGLVDRCRMHRDGPAHVGIELELALDARTRPVPEAPSSNVPADARFDLLLGQNAVLVRTLKELRENREEHGRLSQELEETNRGVVALYAELDERADELRRADQAKSRFLSNVSHELRTPLNSIRALCGLLADQVDGPLTEEQAKQVGFVRSAADDLRQIVDDLLDLAKIAAGKTEVHAEPFEIADLFGTLRGMLKPLRIESEVALHFDAAPDLPVMTNDEAKISQILRNIISNALKFTAEGEVRVRAEVPSGDSTVRFTVADTGIGIAAADRERIFEEFTQIANPLQSRFKGTGLGLPLCRRLAGLLGGTVAVDSEPGKGSVFTVTLPLDYIPAREEAQAAIPHPVPHDAPLAPPVSAPQHERFLLLIDDDPAARYALRRRLEDSGMQIAEAGDGISGLHILARAKPDLVVLDLQLPDMSGEDVLCRMRQSEAMRDLPVAIVTSQDLDEAQRAVLHSHGATILSKRDVIAPDFRDRMLALALHEPGRVGR